MSKIKKSTEIIFDTDKSFFVVTIFTFIIVIFSTFTTQTDYSKALKDLATINITIAIGLGALSFTFKKSENSKIIWVILIQLLLGVASFYISLIEDDGFSKLYLLVNGLLILRGLGAFAVYIIELQKSDNGKNN